MVSDGALEPDAAGAGQHRCATVVPAAELDMLTGPQLVAEVEALVATGRTAVEVDLAHVTFIDSSGLGSLVAVAAEVRTHGGHLAIVAGPPHVRRVFDLLQLDELMELVETRHDALASFTSN